MTKRFEPSREREVLIALDVQTIDGPAWEAGFGSDDVESLYVVAGSLARTLGNRRVAFGLMAAGYTGAETRIASVPVSSAPGQVQRVLDLLARLSSHASAPYERLLAMVARTVRPGTTVLVLTARDPRQFAVALRRLERAGADVVVITGRSAGAAGGRACPVARVRGEAGDDGPPLADGRAPRGLAMTADRRPGSARGSLALVPVGLALIAEAAWTSILAGLLQVLVHHDQTAGIPLMLLACVGGVVATRRIGPLTGDQWPTAAAGLALGAGAIGWLASAEVRAVLATSGIGGLG